MKEFVAHVSPSIMTLIVFASSIASFVFFWILGAFGEPPDWALNPPALIYAFTWASAIMFALVTVAGTMRLFDRRVQLKIAPSGVRWITLSDATIPWSEIEDVTTYRIRSVNYIVLRLRDPRMYRRKWPPLWLHTIGNRTITGGDLCISLVGMDRNVGEALAAMQHFRKEYS